jgi:superfamily II DNA/RNA helicase
MGFLPDMKRVFAQLPKQRQTLLFSATFSDEIRTLAATLASIQAQSLAPAQVVVVDDGSTDDTAALAEAAARRRPGASRPDAGRGSAGR